MIISENDLEKLNELHQKSLHLQAFQLAQTFGDLKEWEGTDAIITAANLAHNLGAVELSARLTSKAWHKDKQNARAMFYYANDTFRHKGALPCLLFIEKYGKDFRAEGKILAWWYCLQSEIYAVLRDFDTADVWHEKAVAVSPSEPWIWVSKAHCLELQDRYEESLEVSRKAFEMDGGQRSSVYQLAHILTLLEKYDEALAILTDAAQRLENAWIVRQLADLQSELEMYDAAYSSFQRLIELTPFREKVLDQWLYGSLSDAAYLTGDVPKAIEYAEKSASPFHLKIKERLENLDGTEKRLRLKLGFVRQHHFTCAPATLSNISRFWSKKAEHLELAEEMCYDGTPAYKERLWANRNGWETREFTINWANAAELINRKVPFTLATIQPGNGHLQAIIGYDEWRKTFLVRDPFYQNFTEYSAEELLENQKSSGPRGMALVPQENAALLQDLELAESRQYDLQFAVDSALEAHDREKAVEMLAVLEKEFPAHRITWSAHWMLAQYDGNHLKLLEAVENLLAQFPEDVNLKLSYLSVADEFTNRAERLKKLEEFATAKKTDPLLWQMFGYEIGKDVRQHGRALHWLYKALRKLPTAGLTYRLIADILWTQRRFEEAARLYRIAACLDDKDENFSYSYFAAMRFLKREDEAVRFLQDRFERFGSRSNLPIQTLFDALQELGRTVEAFEFLEKALQKRPADGELKLFAAGASVRFGKKAEAEKLLEAAENQSSRAVWLKKAAAIAEQTGNLRQSLEYWREISALEPTAYETHENIAFLLSAVEGRQSAQEYLRKTNRRFPFNLGLQKLRLAYLHDETTEAIAILRDSVRTHPQDTWIRRELARRLASVKKNAQALDAAREAVNIDPNDPLNHWSLGMALTDLKNYTEAAAAFKKSLTLSVDADYALAAWLDICRTNEEKNAVLKFVRGELAKQVSFGNGIIAYRSQAKLILEPKELLEQLKEFYRANKDSWFSLAAVVEQLADMYELDEALELAEKNANRFPLIFQVWHDLSTVYKLRNEKKLEIDALRQAVAINPNWSFGVQQLAESLERAGEYAEAEVVLNAALTRMPLDHFLHGYLAEVLWKLGRKDEALQTARTAVRIEPEYDWAWRVIKNWSEELEQPDLAVEMARELTVKKPKDVSAWLNLAQILDGEQFSQEQFDAAEEALKLEPHNTLALAVKANSLADARRFDEAIAVCQTLSEDGHQDERLRYVQAGIEASRGNYDKSIAQLESLAASAPDYYAAWERLAGIYRENEDKTDDYLRVTREMARLAPQEPTVFGYLGEAYLLNNRREEAKKALNRAFSLSPDYAFAGNTLFDLHYGDGEIEDCRAVVEMLERFVNEDSSLVREIVFYAKTEDWERAELLWKKLCLSKKASNPHFEYVFEKLEPLNLTKQNFIIETLRQVSADENANPLVGEYFFARCRQTKSERECLEYLESLPKEREIWAKAVNKHLDILLENDPSAARSFIKKNRETLKQNDESWASTGYVLNDLQEYKKASEWFSDWQNRKKIEPWILWNYSVVLRNLKRQTEANRISREALNLAPDNTISWHLTMLGLDEIHAGDYSAAEKFFRQINLQQLGEWNKFFYFLLENGLKIHQLTAENQTDEAEALTRETIDDVLTVPNLWTDKIKADAFGKSVKAATAVSRNLWLKAAVHLKVFWSKYQ